MLALTVVWLRRTFAKERVFLERQGLPAPPRVVARLGLGARAALRTAAEAEVTFEEGGPRIMAKPGTPLLELAETAEQPIEAGCRMGVCGADPVCVLTGMDNLSPVGGDEKATLERLGLDPAHNRMACCARVQGPVTVSMTPRRDSNVVVSIDFPFDPAVERVVVIGNGIAGVTAADHVRRRHPDCAIDVVAAEPHPLYNRMGISRLIYGRSAMVGLHLLPDAWYDDNRITCWLNTRALQIDRDAGEVVLGTGERLPFDRLILATGSEAFLPEIAGFGRAGTFVLRTASDALGVREYVQQAGAQTAVVAGGGLLGLEAAYALHKLGLRTTVLERSRWLLRRQLDERAGELLRGYLANLGIEVLLEAETAALENGSAVLADGRRLPADVVLVAAGIAPSVELARHAGLEVAARRAGRRPPAHVGPADLRRRRPRRVARLDPRPVAGRRRAGRGRRRERGRRLAPVRGHRAGHDAQGGRGRAALGRRDRRTARARRRRPRRAPLPQARARRGGPRDRRRSCSGHPEHVQTLTAAVRESRPMDGWS